MVRGTLRRLKSTEIRTPSCSLIEEGGGPQGDDNSSTNPTPEQEYMVV